jgi:Zn-dependent peptidase ImmA (M78 family)
MSNSATAGIEGPHTGTAPWRPRIRTADELVWLSGNKKYEGLCATPIVSMAVWLGYKVQDFVPDQVPKGEYISGMIDYGRKLILLNHNEPLVRQRFTLAHEIGHACLHDDGEGAVIDLRSSDMELGGGKNPKETEANAFAADLLMPNIPFAQKYGEFDGNARRLAAFFKVSETAIFVRIKNLGLCR